MGYSPFFKADIAVNFLILMKDKKYNIYEIPTN